MTTPRILSALLGLALTALVGRTAHAQGTYQSRYDRALASHDYRGAASVLRDALRDPASPEAALPLYRAGLAVALLRAGETAAAAEVARACSADPSEAVATQCGSVLRETAPTPEPPAAPAPPPSPAAPREARPAPPEPPAAPVVRIEMRPAPRSWVPSAGPLVLWSLGAASLAASGALAAARSDALAACSVRGDTAVCRDQASLERARESVALTTATNTALAVGLVAIAAGTSWWAIESSRPVAVPMVTTDGASIALAGRW